MLLWCAFFVFGVPKVAYPKVAYTLKKKKFSRYHVGMLSIPLRLVTIIGRRYFLCNTVTC